MIENRGISIASVWSVNPTTLNFLITAYVNCDIWLQVHFWPLPWTKLGSEIFVTSYDSKYRNLSEVILSTTSKSSTHSSSWSRQNNSNFEVDFQHLLCPLYCYTLQQYSEDTGWPSILPLNLAKYINVLFHLRHKDKRRASSFEFIFLIDLNILFCNFRKSSTAFSTDIVNYALECFS